MTPRHTATKRTKPPRLAAMALTVALGASLTMGVGSAAAVPNADLGYPVFAGPANPVPALPAAYTPASMLTSMFQADVTAGAGSDTDHDFWMDQMLVRTGTTGDSVASNSDRNEWLFSRGRALFMKTHDPSKIGFAGQIAYVDSIDNRDAYTVTVASGGQTLAMTEVTAQRKQTPSYWRSVFTNTAAGVSITMTKYITDANVAVVSLKVANTGAAARDITLTAKSPYTSIVDGNELIGTVKAYNNLTTLSPRFSGDAFVPTNGALVSTLSVPAAGSVTTKLQEGFVAEEIANSRTEYNAVRAATPAAAYTSHVTAYNKWWADNIPYIDIPEQNIEKSLYYRWWLMRYNMLDADIPGNDFQYPTAVEGVLGYNNAIVLTSGMFIDDLKYLRDPSYAYGTWVSAGQVAKSGKYVDNPGDPANWSNSYTQYITEAAWRSYLLHGGPSPIAASLAKYGENDIKGLLQAYDSNNNKLIEYNWGAMTGNDADAVSFHWRPGAYMDRAESAYLYSNAKAAAAAYRLAGNTAKATEMENTTTAVQQAIVNVLWDPATKLLEHRIVGGDTAFVPWKEINNYYPYTVGAMPKKDGTAANDQYTEALRLWADADEYPIFPFFTANQKDKAAAAAAGEAGSNNFSIINSTVTFRFLSSALRNYPSEYITAETYKKLLYWNAWAQYQSGDNRYPDQNEFWADGDDSPQKIGYRSWIHHTILGATNFTVIEDVAGLRTREDSKIELSPIDIGWDHFTINNLKYRDKDLTIVWDKVGDGTRHYGNTVPEGYSIYLNGVLALTVNSLKHLVFDPATGTVTFPEGAATVLTNNISSVAAATAVSLDDNAKVVDLFAKAGQDIVTADGNPTNLAAGGAASASYAATGRAAAGAVDGTTINEPFWGTAGSPNATDTLDIDLGSAKAFDDIRVHFYRTSTSATVAGYAEPAAYQLSYLDGSTWKPIPGQLRTPTAPRANLNEARFAPVTAQKIRVTVTHQPGRKTGIKEVLVTSTGKTVTAPGNQAPQVSAYVDTTVTAPGSATLVGSAKDDGLPTGTVTSAWSVVSAPAGAAAVFTTATNPSTTVKFTKDGAYVLRLTATDGTLSSTVDLTVQGTAAQAGGSNVALSATPTADYTAGWNNVNAVNNGLASNSGGAQTDLWGTWSGTRPATRWLQYTWPTAVRVSSSDITFWADSPAGTGDGVAIPSSWKLQYLAADGVTWLDVPNPSGFGVSGTGSNLTTFDAVTTTALRATITANSNGSTNSAIAVSEWAVGSDSPVSTGAVHVPTTVGVIPTLPATVEQVFSDGTRMQSAVTWPAITADQVAAPGSHFDVTGIVDGGGTATATVWVRVTAAVQINVIEPVTASTAVGVAPVLPGTVVALYNDGSKDSRITVTWDPILPAAYAAAGSFEVLGTVAGTDKKATATVTVGDGPGPADTVAPELSVSTEPGAPNGENDWYTGDVVLTATASDDRDTAPLIEAKVDGAATWSPVSAPISLTTDGEHTVLVRASDAAGNLSDTETVTLKIDATEPVSNASFDPDTRTVTLRGADALSRLATVNFQVGSSASTEYTEAFQVPDTATTVRYAAVDRAGNVETENLLQIPAKTAPAADSATALVLTGTSVAVGGTLSGTAVVTGDGTATGTVVVTAGSVEIGRGTLSNGRVKLTLSAADLMPGTVTVTARYSGDLKNLPSEDSATLTVVKATATAALSLTKSKVAYGTKVSARVTVSAPGLAPAGQVTVKEGNTVLGRGTLVAGKVTIALPLLKVGAHKLTVSYPGDSRIKPATGAATLTVVKATSTSTVKVSPVKVTTKTKASVTVAVKSSVTGLVPSGKVLVKVTKSGKTVVSKYGTLLGGKTTVVLPKLAAAGYRVTATYQGTSTVAASSAALSLTVSK